jgi:alginate O-acetyltransferase complex protein AlgI
MFYFLPLTLVVYYCVSFSRTVQNIWLLIVSLVFYAWGEPVMVLLMIGSIMANWCFGVFVDKYRYDKVKSRLIIVFTCIANLGALFVFKYLSWVLQTINTVAGGDLFHFRDIALPIGISFYTFQSMSYVIDVYRDEAKVEKNPFYVGLYVTFFPQLVAGPIVRYIDVAHAVRHRKFDFTVFSDGVCQFVAGLGKKILIANNMAVIADNVFNVSTLGHFVYNVPAMLALVGAVAYALQLFFDFAGYSDMAIGLGKMFGFEFLINFNYPFIADSMTEFWKRWHISLSTWFREYVYFPLGGSKVSNQDKIVRNQFVVWLLTGLWHGAAWTYVLWGLWNFVFLMLERLIKYDTLRIPKVFKHLYLLTVFFIGLIFFRTVDFYQAAQYILNLFGANNNGFYSPVALMFLREYGIFFLLGLICCTPVLKNFGKLVKNSLMGVWGDIYAFFLPFGYLALFIVCVTYLAKGTYNPFIYFNF